MKTTNRFKWVLVLFIMFTACLVKAQPKQGEALLNNFYTNLFKHSGAVITEVQYSGSFSQEISGFTWQRGEGYGWTKGHRATLTHVDAVTLDSLCQLFARLQTDLANVQQVNLYREQCEGATYFDASSTFYGFRLMPDSVLCLLRATAEKEVCIPRDWPTRNYYCYLSPEAKRNNYFWKLPVKQQRQMALSRLWAGVKQNFVFMNRVQVNWDSLYAAFIPQMDMVKTDDEATQLLQRMAAYLHDGHTYVWSVRGVDIHTAHFTTVLLGGHVYVDEVYSSELQKQGIRRGLELTHIDNIPVKLWAETNAKPYVSSSTPQWTEYIMYNGSRLTHRKKGETIKMQFSDGKKSFTFTYEAGSIQNENLHRRQPDVEFKVMETNVGYLRIGTFNGNHLIDEFKKVYPEVLKTRALIIDVRNNEGGNSGNGDFLARSLVADSLIGASWSSPQYIPAYASWNWKQEDYVSPEYKMSHIKEMQAYGKPIIVLVNRGTFSAAEDFAALLQGNKCAQLVGEPTGGSTGNGVRMQLQNGVSMVNICSKYDKAPGGYDFVGHGLMPDVPVEETYDSYFNQLQSAALRKALDLLLM